MHLVVRYAAAQHCSNSFLHLLQRPRLHGRPRVLLRRCGGCLRASHFHLRATLPCECLAGSLCLLDFPSSTHGHYLLARGSAPDWPSLTLMVAGGDRAAGANASKMGGAFVWSSLSQKIGAATSWLRPDTNAAESRRRPSAGAMVASPARANRAFRRVSLAAMPVAHGPHKMLLAATPAKQTTDLNRKKIFEIHGNHCVLMSASLFNFETM